MSSDEKVVLVMLRVPAHWPDLEVEEVTRKLTHNRERLIPFLAKEIVRWGNEDAVDVEGLRELVDGLEADQ